MGIGHWLVEEFLICPPAELNVSLSVKYQFNKCHTEKYNLKLNGKFYRYSILACHTAIHPPAASLTAAMALFPLLLLPFLVTMVKGKYLLLDTGGQEDVETGGQEEVETGSPEVVETGGQEGVEKGWKDRVGTCDILCLRPPFSHPQCCPICGLGCRGNCHDTRWNC